MNTPDAEQAAASGGEAPTVGLLGPYGVPMSAYSRLWTTDDVARFFQVKPPRAREMLREPGAPPPLARGERLLRWNGAALMAWLHGDDWTALMGPATAARRTRPAEARGAAPAAAAPKQPERLLSRPATRRQSKA